MDAAGADGVGTDSAGADVAVADGAVTDGAGSDVAGADGVGTDVAGEGSEIRRWAFAAAAAADDRTGVDTVVIDVGDVLAVTDLFVITHGNNARQVRAITDGITESLKSAGGPSPLRIEGSDDRQWVLIDYGAFVVHVFDAPRRTLYQLERLWGDCPVLAWREAGSGSASDPGA